MVEENPHRLPRDVVPRRYELELAPDLDAATFSGVVDIAVEVREQAEQVVCNAVELEIDRAWIEVEGARCAVRVELDPEAERVSLSPEAPVRPGPAVVHLEFRGSLNDRLRGFYRSRFTHADGTAGTLATTQFEATDARRAFPCWDEPDCKAVFAVALVVDDGLTAVSNAGVVSDEALGDGRRRVRFGDTMVMSTYLVAFVVGPLEVAGPIEVAGVPVRVLCVPGKAHLTAFALDVARFALDYLSDYFALPYPGDTLDLVAIPDFAFGAMENLGCVTFRETLLLVDPDQATQSELQRIVDVISHELAHMWFGDLVTMKWWNGIWLNEAFATFMELKVTDAFRPDWQRWVGFGLSRSTAFDTDALATTRPIEYPVVSPRDAEGMFDVLTYEKGGAVVRMLEQYLGEERFRDGIRHYMVLHRYGNTETTDLWDAIEAATGEPVRRIMDTWIFQGGFPEVTVSGGPGSVALSQRRFAYLPDPATDGRWAVPMVLRCGGESAPSTSPLLLDADAAALDVPPGTTWAVANVEGNGFYRVTYDPVWRAALVAVAQRELSPLERYGLVDDTWASVLRGATPAAGILELAEGFAGETDLSVWTRLVGALGSLARVADDDRLPALAARTLAIVGPALAEVGIRPRAGEADRDRERRGLLLGAAALLGDDPDALGEARRLFAAERAAPGSVDAALASSAIRIVAATAGEADLDAVFAGYRAAATPQEEQRYLNALPEVRDPDQFARALEFAAGGEVRTQNAPFVLGAAVANRDNGAAAWDLVERRWDEMNARFPANSIVWLVNGVRAVFDAALAERIRTFLADRPIPQATLAVAQHLERMSVTVALHEREHDRI